MIKIALLLVVFQVHAAADVATLNPISSPLRSISSGVIKLLKPVFYWASSFSEQKIALLDFKALSSALALNAVVEKLHESHMTAQASADKRFDLGTNYIEDKPLKKIESQYASKKHQDLKDAELETLSLEDFQMLVWLSFLSESLSKEFQEPTANQKYLEKGVEAPVMRMMPGKDDDSVKQTKPEDIRLLERSALLTHIFKFAAKDSKSALVFAQVSQAFRETAVDYPMDAWIGLLKNDRLKALKVIEQLRVSNLNTLEEVATYVTHSRPDISMAAIKALGAIKPTHTKVLNQIVAYLEHSNPDVRLAAVLALGAIQPTDIAAAIHQKLAVCLEDTNLWVFLAVVEFFGKFWPTDIAAAIHQKLANFLKKSPNCVQNVALEILKTGLSSSHFK